MTGKLTSSNMYLINIDDNITLNSFNGNKLINGFIG